MVHYSAIYCILRCTGSKQAVSSAKRDCMSAMQVSQHGITQHTHHIKLLMFLRILHMTRKTVPRQRITSKGCESGTWLTGKLQQKICWHPCVSSPVVMLKSTSAEHKFANSNGSNCIKLHMARFDCISVSCIFCLCLCCLKTYAMG